MSTYGGSRQCSLTVQHTAQREGIPFRECPTKLQGGDPMRGHIRRASKQENEHEPFLFGERLQGGARVARIAKGRAVHSVM